jgi:HK97 family phage major capsid protein
VRDSLRDALTATQDTAFFDPTNGGTPGVKPASITNGAAAIASPGTDADSIRLGVRALFQKFIEADNPPEAGVWIMSTTNALALSIMTNALGQREFPGITMTGGTFEGMPVIASRYAGTNVALVNASDIYEADDGGVAVDMSREASLQMDDNPDNPSTASTVMVSLWQRNLVGLRAERTINWKRRRASAVAYLTGVNWGGAVPAS